MGSLALNFLCCEVSSQGVLGFSCVLDRRQPCVIQVLVQSKLLRQNLEGDFATGEVRELVVAMDFEVLAVQRFWYNFIA